jgi:peptidoglycan/xylan/chitin deacetylase (PgdA/CDA1 family)
MKPVASLSLDADNQWAYLYIRGAPDWASAPSYLPTMATRTLDLVGERGLRITTFAVGRDADRDEDASVFAELAAAGHEIGNHSYRHEPWLHRYSETELEEELGRAEAAIEAATGTRPTGFRGPGYSLSAATLRVLHRRGYAYDASTLPTIIGPVARAVYFRTARLDAAQRAEREHLYGTWSDGLRPLRPYRWQVGTDGMVELPVTAMPWLRLPIHVSYLLALSRYSERAARGYFRAALTLCRATGVEPSLLLHPLDLLDATEAPDLAFFPGMELSRAAKLARVGSYLDLLTRDFDVLSVGEHAARAAAGVLPERVARFAA